MVLCNKNEWPEKSVPVKGLTNYSVTKNFKSCKNYRWVMYALFLFKKFPSTFAELFWNDKCAIQLRLKKIPLISSFNTKDRAWGSRGMKALFKKKKFMGRALWNILETFPLLWFWIRKNMSPIKILTCTFKKTWKEIF